MSMIKKASKVVALTPQIGPGGNTIAQGVMKEIKAFPPSKQGGSGPFAGLTKPAAGSPDFQAWVDYYINFIGSKLEKFNAMQFDMDKGVNKTGFELELKQFAEELAPVRPGEVTWPLSGLYDFEPADPKGGQTPAFGKFQVTTYFEKDSDLEMVVNCSVQVTAQSAVPGGISSSSSYLATSSS